MTDRYGEIPILFEDNHLLVVVKPAGVLSQADGSDAPDMLTLLKEGIRLRYGKPGNVFLGLVHRLDRPVGGVMVFARTSKGASRLSAQIRERSFAKEYLAVVHGRPRDETGTLRDRMVKNASTGDAGFATDGFSGKEAVLHYRLIEWQPEHRAGLLLVRLETGRPHQIRAQLAQAGCPVWNDSRYGASPGGPDAGIALFACRLRFAHPVSREPMRFEAIPPPVEPWSFFMETIRNGMLEEGERQP